MQGELRGATYLLGPEARINLTHPEWSLLLTAPLAEEAGGFGFCKDADEKPVFANTDEPDYQAMLAALRRGHDELYIHLRADMVPAPTKAEIAEAESEIFGVRVHAVSSEANRHHTAIRLIDGSGRDTLFFGAHCTCPADASWLTAGEKDHTPCIVFDLGKHCELSHLRIWNYNATGGGSRHGARDMSISVSTDGASFQPATRVTLARAPEKDNVDYSQRVDLRNGADRVRYVRFDLLSNHDGADFSQRNATPHNGTVGLSEVRFYRLTSGERQ
jgi:hypothetical protein